ncbi:processing protein TSR2 homolog [Seminavis robusta]|uniref:Processing protein TSR2 homolog n=1 Tax=Seminavis robusta TaxID=568900 RepID=A0A9N8HS03_9STRA|nr:processing protein TSR2 homolog [Seminavis robusta]|eukprot:Sro1123_g243640.1 processing protein TSR2 homolog (244) ;mRNA; f:13846-14577
MNSNMATVAPAFPLAEFQAGVTACMRSWSALRTAVEGGWGGNDSIVKADDLRDNIYGVMLGNSNKPTLELEDLEDNLAIYMEEEYSVVLEDASEKQVALTIFQLYEQCAQGQIALAEQLVQTALKYDEQIAAAYPVSVQSTEHDDDDDDDDEDMMDATTTNDSSVGGINISVAPTNPQPQQPLAATNPVAPAAFTTAGDYAAQSLFGKPKKPKAPRPRQQPEGIQVDDDGFATVTKGRRKART